MPRGRKPKAVSQLSYIQEYGIRRRLKVKTPEEMYEKAVEYFARCQASGDSIRICGLTLALGLSSRAVLDAYENREGYSEIVSWMKCVVEDSYEKELLGKHPVGAIFALKQFGWRDRPESSDESANNIAAVITAAIRAVDKHNEMKALENESNEFLDIQDMRLKQEFSKDNNDDKNNIKDNIEDNKVEEIESDTSDKQ